MTVRAAGVSRWASELPSWFLQRVLELLQWEPAVCCAMRAVCSTWSSMHDALLPRRLALLGAVTVMKGKLCWFESVTEVDLTGCEHGVSGVLAELGSMPSLCELWLPLSCAERAVDAEALCGLTTLMLDRLHAPRCASFPIITRTAGSWRRASWCWT